MNQIYIKPDLSIYFCSMPPLTSLWLRFDYDGANTKEELLSVMHLWLNEAERTTNEIKKNCYESSARYLYTLLTGKSYESK